MKKENNVFEVYENIIHRIEMMDVTPQTDSLLQRLGEEMVRGTRGRPALREAIKYVVDNPEIDPSRAARFHRMTRLLGIDEQKMHATVDLLVDVVFGKARMREAQLLASA